MTLSLENPIALAVGVPLAAIALSLLAWSLSRQNQPRQQLVISLILRAAALCLLLLLISRPVWIDANDEPDRRDEVVLLIDRSESMSLEAGALSRYEAAVELARDRLGPAFANADVRVLPYLFADDASLVDGEAIASAKANGKSTDFGRGIVRALTETTSAPRAVFALTDGVFTETSDNARAIALMIDRQIPLVGIGFGSESGARVLSIERVVGPSTVSPGQQFFVAAHMRATGEGPLPSFDLVLLRDGKFFQRRTVTDSSGPRIWQESFEISESDEALHQYTIRLFPPEDESVKCPNVEGSVTVRVEDEKILRVLFVQGGLSWDYKFIRLALLEDPTIKLSGLSRTANNGAFVQSVENETDLVGGFPTTLDDLSQFRVVILSNLRPGDLTPDQQELLARFSADLGGGILMMGGASTFNASWKESRLEQLLPVRFSPLPGSGIGGNFRLQLTDEAVSHPVFQISQAGDTRTAWSQLPSFSQYAVVDSIKPGATVWLENSMGGFSGATRPVLMAAQRYGAGLSAVICVQNFWRWRLAKESNVEHFDRFWRQLLRHLGDGARDKLLLTLPDQQLQPGRDIRVLVDRRDGGPDTPSNESVTFRVRDPDDKTIVERSLRIRSGVPTEASFRTERSGLFKITVLDEKQIVLASRSLEIRDVANEYLNTARNMENLRQWAQLTGGVAVECEQCDDVGAIMKQVRQQNETATTELARHRPAGVNIWLLSLLMSAVCGEWLLRKRWGLK